VTFKGKLGCLRHRSPKPVSTPVRNNNRGHNHPCFAAGAFFVPTHPKFKAINGLLHGKATKYGN